MSAQGTSDGLPLCDTCGQAVVWNEQLGWLHWLPRWRNGVPPQVDQAGHLATAVAWSRE